MSSSNFASFSPYTPPPDDPSYRLTTSSKSTTRPWFPTHPSSLRDVDTSYQSGGIPTFGASTSSGLSAVEAAEGQRNQWETRFGMRVDVLAAVAYLLGPVSALTLLIVETQNDYVRFHAYQSALLMTPLVILRIFVSISQAPAWVCTICTLSIIIVQGYMISRAYRDASQRGLARFQLPIIGVFAEQWLENE